MSDIMDKAYEVQEAAAAAALEENDGGIRVGGWNLDVNGDPWPEDPLDDSTIAGIPAAFEWIDDRDYSGLPAKRQAMANGALVLEGAQGGFTRLTTLLLDDSKFKGSTVNAFVDYLGIIAASAEDQGRLAKELAVGVRAMETTLEATKEDVLDIAQNTIDSLERIKAENVADDITMSFKIASIALGLTTAAFTGGMGFALVGAGLTLAEGAYAVAEDGGEGNGLGGDDVETVLNGETGMYALLKQREDDLFDSEDKLADGLWTDLKRLDGKGDHDRLDDLDPNPGGIVEGRGNLRDTGATVADTEELYELATGHGAMDDAKSNVPQLAKEFSVASSDFDKANGTEAIAMGITSGPWELCLDKLQRLTAKAGQNLYRGGTTLGKAAQDFAKQDGETAKWINETGDHFMDRDKPVFPEPDKPDYYVIEEGPYKGKQIFY